MGIRILELLEGAKKAQGLTVIIDVFRAFSLEAYLLDQNAERLIAVDAVEKARGMKQADPGIVLAGERHGKKLDGFDYGNSPSAVRGIDFSGKTIVHTTSAGTQGLAAASQAGELLVSSLVIAKATAAYIQRQNPELVSLVCMGWEGHANTDEDLLCAEYIRSILQKEPLSDIHERAYQLRFQEGKKFFDERLKEVFPEADFWLCTDVDRFDFAITAQPVGDGFLMRKAV